MTIMMRYSAYARKEYKELVLVVKSQQSRKLSMIINAHLQSKKSFNDLKKTAKNKIFDPHFFSFSQIQCRQVQIVVMLSAL